jgi:nucleotide-binding universal stress UspA family protein
MMAWWFESPDRLMPLLILLAGAGAVSWIGALQRRRAREQIAGRSATVPFVLPAWLRLIALGLISVSLLGPLLTERAHPVDAHGIDVVVVLDTSRSMDARDVPPSRMRRAAHAAHALIDGLAPDDRAALVVFAERMHCDLIMLASHGRSMVSRLMIGSVAETTARYATCGVWVARANND